MSLESVEQALEQRTQAEFETTQQIPTDYGQDGFNAPDNAPWIRQTILGGLDVTEEIDGSGFETSGTLEIQIFTKNRRENARLYDLLAAVYRNQFFSNIHTLDPLRIVVGLRDGWWQTNLSVEWEITTIT